MNGTEDEFNWDALATDLGLEPIEAPKAKPAPVPTPPPPPVPAPVPVAVKAEPPEAPTPTTAFQDVFRDDEFAVEPASVAEAVEPEPAGEGVVEDAADVLDDEAPESGDEGAGEGEGKGRRRRRRRRRKKGGAETVAAESGATAEESEENATERDVLAFPTSRDEEPEESVPAEIGDETFEDLEEEEEEVEEIIPAVALATDMEEESTEPLPEWKVTAWTELVATLYRPQDR